MAWTQNADSGLWFGDGYNGSGLAFNPADAGFSSIQRGGEFDSYTERLPWTTDQARSMLAEAAYGGLANGDRAGAAQTVQSVINANPGYWSSIGFSDPDAVVGHAEQLFQRRLTNQDDDRLAPILNNLWMAPFAAAAISALGTGFSMPSGAEGVGAFEAPSFSGTFNPALPGAVEGAGTTAAAAGVDGLTPLQAALQNPPPVGGSLTGSYSTMGYSTGLQSVPAMSYAEGVLGGGVPSATLPVESAGLLDGLWDKTKSVFSDPMVRTGLQAAQMGAKLLGDDGDAQAKQQSSQAGFYSSLASLISAALASRQGGSSGDSSTPAFNSTYNASQAVAPDQRSTFLYGSSGKPSTQAFTMEKGAPSAVPMIGGSGSVGGTPTAPTMPSQEQGAIRMRRKMYA